MHPSSLGLGEVDASTIAMSQITEPLRRDYIIRFGAALATQEAAGAKEKAPSQGPQVQTRPGEPPHR